MCMFPIRHYDSLFYARSLTQFSSCLRLIGVRDRDEVESLTQKWRLTRTKIATEPPLQVQQGR
jgi:hypothetical protein